MSASHRATVPWAVAYVVLAASRATWAEPLSAAHMYLEPNELPDTEYEVQHYAPGYTMEFSGVQRLQVMPLLDESGTSYLYYPGVHYTGDITGTLGTLAFGTPGPYTVKATYTDGSSEVFVLAVGCVPRSIIVVPKTVVPKNPARLIADPYGGDVVVVDPEFSAMKASDYSGNPEMLTGLPQWQDVGDSLQGGWGQDVTLDAHGTIGKVGWQGSVVLNKDSDEWFKSMKGTIDYLNLTSCMVARGQEGSAFLAKAANALGKAAGYEDILEHVAENIDTPFGVLERPWFAWGEGKRKVFTARPVTYTFAVDDGSIAVKVRGEETSGVSPVAGTFTVTINHAGAHITDLCDVSLDTANLCNTLPMQFGLTGVATGTVQPGGIQLLDFDADYPGFDYFESGGCQVHVDPYVQAEVIVSGVANTTFTTATTAGTMLPFDLSYGLLSTPGGSQGIEMALVGTFSYELGLPDVGKTLTLDLVFQAHGTAHVVPDPALSGLAALGIAGAGVWLRSRCGDGTP